ncbi:hypothetical protein AAU01_26940 [Paenarthrobacter aurescens]|uniref:Uncharacterized protein n=1 Tax=Paenarthrobacter aurescens TaxID=43663 RepID=A0A4Y3NMI5_PAEAU|nr:hypothetical protein AAU01_26940 [Paenarthrobacter aurescens]
MGKGFTDEYRRQSRLRQSGVPKEGVQRDRDHAPHSQLLWQNLMFPTPGKPSQWRTGCQCHLENRQTAKNYARENRIEVLHRLSVTVNVRSRSGTQDEREPKADHRIPGSSRLAAP